MSLAGLVAQLERKRRELRLTGEEMGPLLGVSGNMYRKVVNGVRNPGSRMLGGITAQFPELAPHIWAFLLSRNETNGSRQRQVATEMAAKGPGKAPGRRSRPHEGNDTDGTGNGP